ncbi:MAG: protein kinase [Polyangiaceae bacterium]|nr:protein kinase [Polyangiaceae bacterium]
MVATRLHSGEHLGRYELLTPIAQGGMGAVWAARQVGQHGFRKTVAIKTLLPGLSEDATFEKMFLTEARVVMRLHHPNVVQVLDLGEEQGVLFQVMEWIDGESVSTLLKVTERDGVRIPIRLAAFICIQAALGLHAAHEATDDDDQPFGIVHRDVSPQNVMVTYDGHVKVVDFGVAKSSVDGAATGTGEFLKGKVPYMAPEQASGERIDRRTDVFSLGTLLYRLTTGTHPFLGDNQIVTLNNVLACRPAPPKERVADFPDALEAIILRCLQKDRDLRFSDMAEVAAALETAIATTDAPVGERELATFVRTQLSEHRVARRAAMRQAGRALGWASSTSDSLPRFSDAPASGETMTPSGTGPGIGSFTPPSNAPVTLRYSATPSASNVRPWLSSSPDSKTQLTYVHPPSHTRRRTAFIAVALVAIASAGVAAFLSMGRNEDPARQTARASEPPRAAPPSEPSANPGAPQASIGTTETTAPASASSPPTEPSSPPVTKRPIGPAPIRPKPTPTTTPAEPSTAPDLGF